MLIEGSFNTERENLLVEKYVELINNESAYNEILVILLNPYQKAIFINKVKEKLPNYDIDKAKVYTTNGLYYNAFKDNEEYIKKILKYNKEDKIELCGLEISQYIFKQSIKEADFSDYISKINLLHQLFRRYALIVNNNLSKEDIEKRSDILKESFSKDAQKAIQDYKLKTIEYRSFDYLRQAAIFPLIYKETEYFKNIKYIIVDDADEMTYLTWEFINYLIPQLKNYIIAYDKNGSTRCGYLCAYKSGINEFKKKYSPKEITLHKKSKYSSIAEEFSENIKTGKLINLEFCKKNSVRRLEMIDSAIKDINELISLGVKAHEIAIVSPLIDAVLLCTLKDKNFNINFQLVSGNEKLSDIKSIKHALNILKIVNNLELNDYEIKSILINLLNIPYRKCYEIIQNYKSTKEFININIDNFEYTSKYIKFKNIIKSLKEVNYSLTEQIKVIFSNLIKGELEEEEITKFDFLIKEANSFENTFNKISENIISEFIIQIENSVISENPTDIFSIKANKVIIATPQKIIDYKIKTKYQFWLDISNNEWFKQDTGTLYNAWVFNRDWSKEEYTLEDNIKNTRDKTARIIRKLMLCCEKEIKLYSSIYDNTGNENFGGINEYIETKEQKTTEMKIIPRDDQKPVLEYKKGKMGIMAVPGAGKTTILLALVSELINSGVCAENIFVLTYMESAAKNFKERIKSHLNNSSQLPNISTIHGLALRIIKENGNYTKVGLDENFEICDDNTKERILKEIFYKLKIQEDKYDNFLRSISIVKLSENKKELYSKYQDIQEFYNFYKEYNITLKKLNLIDYDDMLSYALLLLKNNKEIAQYYQDLCEYIIEDEAQDSTEIQQSLIKLLSAKHKNIIRCGDINQSITSTFTNSNLESFKEFIKVNKKIEMVSSQRCAKPIYSLANKMIQKALSSESNKKAFYPIEMISTQNNPKIEIEPELLYFEKEIEEKEFILNKIRQIKKENPQITIAILLRLNSQVNDYNEFLNSNNISTAIRTDCLAEKKIYKFIYSVLKIISNPINNKEIEKLAILYAENKYKNDSNKKELIKEYFNNLKQPFIRSDIDEIEEEILIQLYLDVDYWLNSSDISIEEIALKAGIFYSKDYTDKSNTYLISTFIKHLKINNETNEELIKKLEYYSKKSTRAYKFFEEENKSEEPTINIRTMHKSKGDEFDIVFIPQLTEENYPTNKIDIKLKSGGHFVETIKSNIQNCKIKTPDELKEELIEETLRLLYVGITRAKKGLILTYSQNYKIRKNAKHNIFMENLLTDSKI